MTTNKCPKCGFMTLATATVCKNCSYKFTGNEQMNNASTQPQETGSWIDTFCVLNLLASAIACGIIFCLYWDYYVLSNILPSGSYPIILLIAFYLPAGILAIVCGGIWYGILRAIFKMMGFRVSEVG